MLQVKFTPICGTTAGYESQIFTPLRSTTPVFQIIEVWGFLVRYNGEFEIFEKKSLKAEIPNLHKFVSTISMIRRKSQDRSENVWLRFLGGVAF